MPTIQNGDVVSTRQLTTIDDRLVSVPDPQHLTHLQFRRFAGCPICHLHVRSVAKRHHELKAAGVVEIVVFHSDSDSLRRYQTDLPFAVIADPERTMYREFGVESSLASIAHPRAWLAAARGTMQQRSVGAAMGRGEDHLGKPADFLIASDGTVVAAKYGAHADDQWTVDEILGLTQRHHAGP